MKTSKGANWVVPHSDFHHLNFSLLGILMVTRRMMNIDVNMSAKAVQYYRACWLCCECAVIIVMILVTCSVIDFFAHIRFFVLFCFVLFCYLSTGK